MVQGMSCSAEIAVACDLVREAVRFQEAGLALNDRSRKDKAW